MLNVDFEDIMKSDEQNWNSDEIMEESVEEINEEDYLEGMEPSKKSMTIFFLIDTSGSMGGTKIGTVNGTMEELLPELIGLGGSVTDISIAVMKYASNVEWITKDGPVRVEEYQEWSRQTVGGTTAMGAAFRELNSKLSRSSFMNKPSLSYAPVIFLMTDGNPNDDWEGGLDLLRHNSWYKYALKIAIGIGSEPNMDILREFTGEERLAIQAHNAKELKKLITFLTVTSSKIGSQSMSLTNEGKELTMEDVSGDKVERMVNAVQDIMGDEVAVQDLQVDEGW